MVFLIFTFFKRKKDILGKSPDARPGTEFSVDQQKVPLFEMLDSALQLFQAIGEEL